MSNISDTDSRELALLRLRFKIEHPGLTATPERLGKYARNTRTAVTDYGAHSKRWVRLFETGFSGIGPMTRRPKQLLFWPTNT